MDKLNVTEPTLAQLSGALDRMKESKKESAPTNACFRIQVDDSSRLALAIDVLEQEDVAFEHQGETVLVISEDLAERFEGKTLDLNKAGDFVLS